MGVQKSSFLQMLARLCDDETAASNKDVDQIKALNAWVRSAFD